MNLDRLATLLHAMAPKLFLMFMRGTSLLSKFMLLIVMGRYLSFGDIGIYGLILGVAVIYSQAAGWGFGFYLNRQMVKAPLSEQRLIFSRQWGIFLYTYAASMLLAAPLFLPSLHDYTGMDAFLLSLALFIVLSEHATFELSRLLIITKRAMKGNIVLFLHSAGWALPVAGLLFFVPAARSLEIILSVWCALNALSFIIGIWWCREYIGTAKELMRNLLCIPLEWVRSHMGPSLTVYIAFLANVLVMYLNRFSVGAFLGIDEAGLFTLYWSVVNALYLLAQTGLIQTAYPAMIEVSDKPESYRQKLISLYKQVAIFAVVSGAVMAAAAPFLFMLMDKEEAVDNLPFFYALLGCGVLKLMATVSFYALYARHADKGLMKGMLAVLAIGAPVSVVAVMTMGLWGSAFSEGFFSLAMVAILFVQYRKKTLPAKA